MDDITICITTFKLRFDLFKNLVLNIKRIYPKVQILVTVNGNYDEKICEDYRIKFLEFIKSQSNIIPIMIPEFRSLAKLWNTMIIFSNTEYNLILNDDLVFENCNILETIEKFIKKHQEQLFTINYSWSHYVITKSILNELGYFDERLLALGFEDGDMVWRYIDKYKKDVPNIVIDGLYNLADYKSKPKNIKCFSDNKPEFNLTFIEEKYKIDNQSEIAGMFGLPRKKIINDEIQYPYENFYMKNKKNIKFGTNFDI